MKKGGMEKFCDVMNIALRIGGSPELACIVDFSLARLPFCTIMKEW